MNMHKSVCRRLQGKVAIVTGGGHGLGRAYAQRLAAEGAHVVLADIDHAAADQARQRIQAESSDVDVVAIALDVTDIEAVRDAVAQTVSRFGRIDILVNNAAVYATVPISYLPFDELTVEEWDRVMEVNVKGVWFMCRAVADVMKGQAEGTIINISSGTALKGRSGMIHYVASKAGILGFTRTLAHELGDHGIRVNCVAPGNTLSEDQPSEESRNNRTRAVRSRALQRVQTPEDVVGAVAFFASPDSAFITGQTLVVDGGSHMH